MFEISTNLFSKPGKDATTKNKHRHKILQQTTSKTNSIKISMKIILYDQLGFVPVMQRLHIQINKSHTLSQQNAGLK